VTEEFFNESIAFLKNHSIQPPDDIEGNLGKTIQNKSDTSGLESTLESNSPPNLEYRRIMRSRKIGYVTFFKDTQADLVKNGMGIDRGKVHVLLNKRSLMIPRRSGSVPTLAARQHHPSHHTVSGTTQTGSRHLFHGRNRWM
jgi:hypothetical protein